MYQQMQIEAFEKYKEKIEELLMETYALNFKMNSNEVEQIVKDKITDLTRYIIDKGAICIGDVEAGHLRGFLWMYVHEYFGETRLHINQIVVDKQYRGMGIGRSLMNKAEEKARDLGVRAIDLFVSENNIGALQLYNGLGFETERRYMKKEVM